MGKGVVFCAFAPELRFPVGLFGRETGFGGTVRRCFMLGGEATVPGLEWPLGCWDKPC